MNIAPKSSFVLNRPHLLGIEGLSREEIVGLLDLAEEFVELNRPEQSVSNKAESAVNACCGTTSPGLVLLCRGLSEHRVKQ